MAHRLDTYVIQGEISNLCRNSVTGRLEVLRAQSINGRTVTRPAVLLLSLTGNLSAGLCGRRLRFSSRQPNVNTPNPLPDFFHSEQIGVLSDSLLRIVTAPSEAEDTAVCSGTATEPSMSQYCASVYLEWHSQNGTVALELLDPILELDHSVCPPSASSVHTDDTCFEIISDQSGCSGESTGEAMEDDQDDLYQLFDPSFEEQIRQSATESRDLSADSASVPLRDGVRGGDPAAFRPSRSNWDEIIPGIDPETRRLYETWDEVLRGEKDEPLTLLFDEPLCLPTPSSLRDEAHAWQVLTQLLRAMALRGVAFDMCPHVSAIAAYRLLIEELLPEAGVHPGLVDTGFICHFGTAEFCTQCQAELDGAAQ